MIAMTNLQALACWHAAYHYAGDEMLIPFGLSANEIDAVLTVGPDTHRAWAESQERALVVPRPGILSLLASGDELQIRRIRDWRGGGALDELPQALNDHLLGSWTAMIDEPELCRRLALDEQDRRALRAASQEQRARWSRQGIALGIPRPGVLPELFAAAEPALTTFLRSLSA